jgi:hypothetical protein
MLPSQAESYFIHVKSIIFNVEKNTGRESKQCSKSSFDDNIDMSHTELGGFFSPSYVWSQQYFLAIL